MGSNQLITNGLVGNWRPSREATGNLLIDSVRSNHGALTNGPTWAPSAGGGSGAYALSCNGSNNYVSVANVDALNLLTNFTVSIWVNPATFTNYQNPIHKGVSGSSAQYGIIIFSSGNWYGQLNSDLSGGVLTLNQWWHLVLTLGNATGSVYTNGKLITTAAASTTFRNAGVNIGADIANTRYFNGLVDDVAIFNRALTPNEILTLYTAGRGALDKKINKQTVLGSTSLPTFKSAWASGSNILVNAV
jgi:hypothetical protein